MCIWLDLSERNDFSVWLNGEELYSETYSIPQMLSVCQVQVGDVVDVVMACDSQDSGTISVSAALMEENAFWAGYEKLSASTLELTDFSTTKLRGTINCDRDGLLYTSIPQNGNWHAYVDGQEAETVLVGEAMLAIHLTEGEHDISFRYRNKAFTYGCMISLACSAVLVGLWVWYYPKHKPKGKYAK